MLLLVNVTCLWFEIYLRGSYIWLLDIFEFVLFIVLVSTRVDEQKPTF